MPTSPVPPLPPATSPAALAARLRAALRAALRSRDMVAAAAIRSALGAIGNAEAVPPGGSPVRPVGSQHIAGAGLGAAEVPRRALTEDDVAAIVAAEVTERQSAADQYQRLGREDQAALLRREVAILVALLGDVASRDSPS
jgi:uncharacterized protein YqeY